MDSSPTTGANGSSDAVARALQDIQAQLTQLNDRMDRIEQLSVQGQGVGAVAMDTFDAHIDTLRNKGIDVGERLDIVHDIIEALTHPDILRGVHHLVEDTDQVTTLLQGLRDLPGMAGTAIEIFDNAMRKARENGLDIDQRLNAMIAAGKHLSSPAAISTLEALFDQDMLNKERAPRLANPILQLLVDASGAIREVSDQPPERTGVFGLLRAGRDKDIQTFTTFSLRLARALGQRLSNPTEPTPPRLDSTPPSITE